MYTHNTKGTHDDVWLVVMLTKLTHAFTFIINTDFFFTFWWKWYHVYHYDMHTLNKIYLLNLYPFLHKIFGGGVSRIPNTSYSTSYFTFHILSHCNLKWSETLVFTFSLLLQMLYIANHHHNRHHLTLMIFVTRRKKTRKIKCDASSSSSRVSALSTDSLSFTRKIQRDDVSYSHVRSPYH